MTYRREFDDDGAPVRRTVRPAADFEDTRSGIAGDATVWGDAPRKDLEPMEEVLDTVLGRLAAPDRTALDAIVASWDRISSPGWQEARPVRVDGETLTVEVPNGMVASRLQFDTTRLVDRLGDVAGGTVRRVRFRVARA